MKKIFSIDSGKGFTKYAKKMQEGNVFKSEFITRYTELDDLNDLGLIGKDSFLVEYNGKNYLLGQQGESNLRDARSKKNEIHRVAALTATTVLLDGEYNDEEKNELTLIIPMPGTSYKSKEERTSFQEFYKGEGDINIRVNGKEYNFQIEKVIAMPEGAGLLWRHPDLCVGRSAVVDLGHLNIGFVTFNGQNIDKLTSLDEGGEVLEQQAIERLEAKIGEKVDSSVIIECLEKGYYSEFGEKVEGTDEIISEVKHNYVEGIIPKAKTKGVRLSDMHNIYFIGGTSLLLKDEIEKHSKLSQVSRVLEDSKWVTVIGNLIWGEGAING